MIASHYLTRVSLKTETIASFEHYPFSLPAVRALHHLDFHPKVTFLVGENGSGKSTLLEAIAVSLGFNAEGGSKHFNFSTHASHSPLHAHLRLARGVRAPRDGFFLRAESFFNVATEVLNRGPDLIDSYGGKSLHAQSHGESFLALMMHRFRGQGLYLLDEPEAALSPQRQLSMLSLMHELVTDRSQFIIATHSPILMAYPDARIYACSDTGIRRVAYEDTEHYQVMHDFLANPKRMLDILLAPRG